MSEDKLSEDKLSEDKLSEDKLSDDTLGADAKFTADGEVVDCAAVIADVWTLLDNECDPVSRERVQHHLDYCGPCLEAYGIEEKIKSLIGRKCGGERAPDGLRERLSIEIRKSVVITTIESRER